MANVGIVIVSHSPKVAEGAADMVRQMVGRDVPLAWTGGNPAGGLGTSFEAITEAIHRAWSEAGVAILVDLGGAETNSEMAIEMLPKRSAPASSSATRRSSRGRSSRRPKPRAARVWPSCGGPPRNCRRDCRRPNRWPQAVALPPGS